MAVQCERLLVTHVLSPTHCFLTIYMSVQVLAQRLRHTLNRRVECELTDNDQDDGRPGQARRRVVASYVFQDRPLASRTRGTRTGQVLVCAWCAQAFRRTTAAPENCSGLGRCSDRGALGSLAFVRAGLSRTKGRGSDRRPRWGRSRYTVLDGALTRRLTLTARARLSFPDRSRAWRRARAPRRRRR